MKHVSDARMHTVVSVLLIGFIVVAFRAQHLSVTVAEENRARGGWRTVSTVEVEGPRGPVVDRAGRALAESVLAYTLVVDPRHFFTHERDRLPELVRLVGGRGRLTQERLDTWARMEVRELPRSFVVERRLSPARAQELMSALGGVRISALYLLPEYQRVYPQRSVAGHTVGFVQRTGGEGLAGVERTWNEALQGRTVSWTVERDVTRRAFLWDEPPDLSRAAGHTVELSLDLGLQRYVEQVLTNTVQRYEAESGVVIVSRPQSGELLAMAAWPPVDPNLAHGDNPEAWLHPGVAQAWEPGSTAKSFTFAMAFERGLIGQDTMIDTGNGRVRVGGHWVRDVRREASLPAWRVMALSSNIGSLRIGMQIDPPAFREGLVAFGFGSRPGTGLPGETAGLLRRTPWREIEHANIAFGHGFAASPLQVHMATAALANDGVRMRPILVRRVLDAAGEPVEVFGPVEVGRVVSAQAARETVRTLIAATQPDGTGVRAAVPGFVVAGKTGTGELFNPETGRYEQEYLSSFAGFAPAEDPQVVVTVQVVRPNKRIGYFGGVVAAPLFAEVAAESLRHLGIVPSPADGATSLESLARIQPTGAAVPDQGLAESSVASLDGDGPIEVDAARPVGPRMVDLRGRTAWEVMHLAGEEGFTVHLVGSGRVLHQWPEPGAPLEDGGVVRVELGGVSDRGRGRP